MEVVLPLTQSSRDSVARCLQRVACADPAFAAAEWIAPATVFVSHAWRYKCDDVFNAMIAFADREIKRGASKPYFWLVCEDRPTRLAGTAASQRTTTGGHGMAGSTCLRTTSTTRLRCRRFGGVRLFSVVSNALATRFSSLPHGRSEAGRPCSYPPFLTRRTTPSPTLSLSLPTLASPSVVTTPRCTVPHRTARLLTQLDSCLAGPHPSHARLVSTMRTPRRHTLIATLAMRVSPTCSGRHTYIAHVHVAPYLFSRHLC